MATYAPASPGTEQEGNWYVPVIGMGAGSVIGQGMKALRQQWSEALIKMKMLPSTENLASMAGGINTYSPAKAAVEYGGYTVDEVMRGVAKPTDLGKYAKYVHDGGGPIRLSDFPAQSVSDAGGKVVPKDVMDRVMNAGLRDKILGFGEKTKPKDYMGLKEIRKDFDDYYGK